MFCAKLHLAVLCLLFRAFKCCDVFVMCSDIGIFCLSCPVFGKSEPNNLCSKQEVCNPRCAASDLSCAPSVVPPALEHKTTHFGTA